MYFSQTQAVQEIQCRTQGGVKEKVLEWWHKKGWAAPLCHDIKDTGVLFRPIATCRYEDIAFFKLADAMSLQPLWLEATEDVFLRSFFHECLINPCKKTEVNGVFKRQTEKLVDLDNCEGTPLYKIQTLKGNSLVEYHHALQDNMIPNVQRFDLSTWKKSFSNSKDYYSALLSLFVAHAILFHNNFGGEFGFDLNGFMTNIFLPARELVIKELDLKPVIVSLEWNEEMKYYPSEELGTSTIFSLPWFSCEEEPVISEDDIDDGGDHSCLI